MNTNYDLGVQLKRFLDLNAFSIRIVEDPLPRAALTFWLDLNAVEYVKADGILYVNVPGLRDDDFAQLLRRSGIESRLVFRIAPSFKDACFR